GALTFTRRAKDNTCNTTLTPSTGQWVLTVRPVFTPGAIATAGQTICNGAAVTTIGNTTSASGGDNNISYQWYYNGNVITGATQATYSPAAYNTTTGALTFTRRAKDNTCNTTLTPSTGQWVLTVHALPTITLTTANSSQTVYAGSTITPIKYTTANATGASIIGQPSGVSGAWASNTYTVSGTPASAGTFNTPGTFNYTVTTSNTNTCNNATANGSIIVKSLWPPYSNTSASWSCGAQTWSGAVSNPEGCAGVTALSTSTPFPAQYVDRGANTGYYYSASCAFENAPTLCPSPWRVPAQQDYEALKTCTGTPLTTSFVANWTTSGFVSVSNWSSGAGYYWTTTRNTTDSQAQQTISPSSFYGSLDRLLGGGWGCHVKCVK
ncbi:MAG: hypothetical protein LBU42_06900, partial [Prevotellaceae bacterium]|nr:hypothetical protein [Prevotellaceae bacterium]